MLTRRDLLKSSTLIALAPSIPLFLQRTGKSVESHPDERILVVIQLSGGNDGLNTVVPFADEGYQQHRKTLRLPDNLLHKLDDCIGLHPSMRDAAELFEQGRLTIVQGVGYPNPNRSHDVSMAIWHTAQFDREQHRTYGWIGRALDSLPATEKNAPSSVMVGNDASPVILRGRKCVSSSFNSMDDLKSTHKVRPQTEPMETDSDNLSYFVSRTALDAYATSDLLTEVAGRKSRSAVAYPTTQLSERLRLISQLIQADLGTRVYYAVHDGYDTHSVQLGQHATLLRELSQGMKAFLDDLANAGLEDKVLVMCFSEFGRQVQENASSGTDHGTAGPVFLAGASVTGRLYGKSPDLQNLDNNAPFYTTDFRSVYATVLDRWLAIDPKNALLDEIESLSQLF